MRPATDGRQQEAMDVDEPPAVPMTAPIDIVLTHDYLLVMRGAERSFTAMCDLWPSAPVATLLYDHAVFGQRLAGHPIRVSKLQRLGRTQSNFKALLPLMPLAAERLAVKGHDVVVSSSSAFAHGARPSPGAIHVCYCYTPFRYAWYERDAGVRQAPRVARPLVAGTLSAVQRWDRHAASRGTHYIAISELSQQRIFEHWGVEAPIVSPPVELSRFSPGEPEDFILVVSELVSHKHVELVLEAARRVRHPVKVVGGGTDERRLQREYGGSAEFLGRIDDTQLAELYRRARAFVMPNVEEFGISAVEAQAAGRPVIAAAGGGALETVIDGQTGFLFPPGDADALAQILRDDAIESLNPEDAISNAQRFSVGVFQSNIGREVARAVAAAR